MSNAINNQLLFMILRNRKRKTTLGIREKFIEKNTGRKILQCDKKASIKNQKPITNVKFKDEMCISP